ncbi:MAG: hypothetical protein NC483_06575 [Ruminococcus sp.]|nr:hypothetical protein [Ruminococcus sp.]
MITFKETMNKMPKDFVYDFYTRIIFKRVRYDKITKKQMYEEIINLYQENPEVILSMCSIEEISVLKSLLDEDYHTNEGYIEYTILRNLLNNYLIEKDKSSYYIPKDLINYVKMALNLYNEESYYIKDIADSVFLGIIRIYNTLSIDEFEMLLKEYNIYFSDSIKKYIKTNPKLNRKIKVIKYQSKDYVISLEYYYYKDVLKFMNNISFVKLKLEELISIGKYKIDLFKEPIFRFLSFLEAHLQPMYIDMILDEILVYVGFNNGNLDNLNAIADNIKELYQELMVIVPYLPIWIFKGNSLLDLEKNNN